MSRVSLSNKEKILVNDNLVMNEIDKNISFQHRWWHILLIIFAVAAFILTCVFNGLASTGPNSIFTQRTGSISDQNLTEFTPAGWTFSIWGVIYFWQAAWLIYALSRIFRKSNDGYLYIVPNTLHFSIFIYYIINMGLNIGWLILWDRQHFGWALLVIFLMFVTIILPMIVTHILLQRNRLQYINSNCKADIWLVRVFVHNGFAIYGTWLYLATLLNLTIWISQIYNRSPQSITDASTAALSLVLIGIVIYFISENILFYSSMAYTYLPWFVLIFGLSGVVSKNYNRKDIPNKNKLFALALLIICCVLFIFRVIIFIIRYVTKKIPTIHHP
ncbi:unnamed protein product [Rotaria sordida]|uniref:Uncharacterized protein n=1 Tax=Rotaria sordida TaxID=392033 RepID=A0A813PBC8_9BILA|nr:unnamed protein product [Rotaria sordida]CAF0975630.1 unnamed protein product [Rotaria sordida]CAF3919036.1 unnamed protein product [Rotaria sordida]